MKVCSTDGCEKAQRKRGLCNNCYGRAYYAKPENTEKARAHYAKPAVKEAKRARAGLKLGFTPLLESQMLAKQCGLCKICKREMAGKAGTSTSQTRDHDHSTGKARALLCKDCNLGLGLYEKHLRGTALTVIPFEVYLYETL